MQFRKILHTGNKTGTPCAFHCTLIFQLDLDLCFVSSARTKWFTVYCANRVANWTVTKTDMCRGIVSITKIHEQTQKVEWLCINGRVNTKLIPNTSNSPVFNKFTPHVSRTKCVDIVQGSVARIAINEKMIKSLDKKLFTWTPTDVSQTKDLCSVTCLEENTVSKQLS